jgi:tRNA A37 threonylcarbamoyladenosine dehydratase
MQNDYAARFSGIERLVGKDGQKQLRAAHVAVVGVGGVGSWSAEALARSGIGAITLVDFDEVCVSNVNRQLPALTPEIGKAKVGVLRERILEINPECRVHAVQEYFTATNAAQILETRFDFVIDAIDHVRNKCLLLAGCRARGIPVITTGAAGGRLDATSARIADLAECTHDRLLQRVRKVLRSDFGFPGDGLKFGIEAVYSPEPVIRPGPAACEGAPGETGEAPRRLNCDYGYGSAIFVTGVFGFAAAGRVVTRLAHAGQTGGAVRSIRQT